MSGVHHLSHIGHPFGEEGGVLKVTCQILHSHIAEHPGLLATADRGEIAGASLITALTPLSLTLSSRTLEPDQSILAIILSK